MLKGNDVEILLISNNNTDVDIINNELLQTRLANKMVHLTSGEEGLDFIFGRGKFYNKGKRKFPTVIFLDIKAPVIDGIEVLRHIKANEITRVIPVVVFASSIEEKEIINSYHLAVNSYFIKPSEVGQFAKLIHDIVHYWLIVNQSPVIKD